MVKKVGHEFEFTNCSDDYIDGFESAMKLDLPILFLKWFVSDEGEIYVDYYKSKGHMFLGENRLVEEAYQYWLDEKFKIL